MSFLPGSASNRRRLAGASSSPSSSPFPKMHSIPDPGAVIHHPPRPVYVSLSSHLRLLHVNSPPSEPTSILDFRKPNYEIALTRMPDDDPALVSPVEDIVAHLVLPMAHVSGPAVRISDGTKRAVILVASSENERDALLLAVRLRVAPWSALLARVKADMFSAPASVVSPSTLPQVSTCTLANAARAFLAGGALGSGGNAEDETAEVARKVWENAGRVAEWTLWTATFGKGFGEIAQSAGDLASLTKPFGMLAVVGCVFSVISISARAVHLMALEREGRGRLDKARNDLSAASVFLVSWLFSILETGFDDNVGLVDRTFDVFRNCWQKTERLEKYLFDNWVKQVWKAEDIRFIVANVESITGKLYSVRVLKVLTSTIDQVQDHETLIGELEGSSAVDLFRVPPRSFDRLSTGLVKSAATSLARLKTAIGVDRDTTSLVGRLRTGLVKSAATSLARLKTAIGVGSTISMPCVALTSVCGEGGVGKTCTCRLLREDADVRAYFSDGAIVWIDVGMLATEDKVRNEIWKAVSAFGGERSAGKVMLANDFAGAVQVAREFFSEKRILVIADNVWQTPPGSEVRNWASELAEIVSHHGSAFIFTTRSSSIARTSGFGKLELGRFVLTSENESSSDWRVANGLFDEILEASEDEKSSEEYKSVRRKALLISCGLLLAIRTITSLVHSYREAGIGTAETVLLRIENRSLFLGSREVGEDEEAAVGHRGLFAAMEESLGFLDRWKGTRIPEETEADRENGRLLSANYASYSSQTFSARYASLHMLATSSTAISFSLLRHLWHVATIAEVEDIVLLFVDIGLGRVEGEQDKYFILHVLQHEFCRTSSTLLSSDTPPGGVAAKCVPVNGHALFLSSCEALLSSQYGERMVCSWPHFCFEFDVLPSDSSLRDYLPRELIRHLCCAAPRQDTGASEGPADRSAFRHRIMSVLFDYFWLRGRFHCVGGRSSLLSDLDCAIESGILEASDIVSVRELRRCLMLVHEDDLGFFDGTLASSFVQLAQSLKAQRPTVSSDLFEQLAREAEEHVDGTWPMPINGCSLTLKRDEWNKVAVDSSGIEFVGALGDKTHFISRSVNGAARLHDFARLSSVCILEKPATALALLQSSVADNYALLFSGHEDGSVLHWKACVDEPEQVSESSSSCTIVAPKRDSGVSCLSISYDGNVVAAGYDDGLVFVWKRAGNDSVTTCYEVLDKFNAGGPTTVGRLTPPEKLLKVVVSRSGRIVVGCIRRACHASIFCWKDKNCEEERVTSYHPAFFPASHPTSSPMFWTEDPFDMFVFDDESCLIVLFREKASYIILNIERLLQDKRMDSPVPKKLKHIDILRCASAFSGKQEYNMRQMIRVGGFDAKAVSVFAEFSVEADKLKFVRACHLSVVPKSVCGADFGGDSGPPSVVVGGRDGSICVLGKEAFDLNNISERRDGDVFGDGEVVGRAVPLLKRVSAVSVLFQKGLIVAGHEDGRLSLWLARYDDSFRVFCDERSGYVTCIACSSDESLVVSGQKGGNVLLWETSFEESWKVRFVLDGSSTYICCAAVSEDNRTVFTVDNMGKVSVWDISFLCACPPGDAQPALTRVISTRVADYSRSRAFVSPDNRHVLWATLSGDAWNAVIVDADDAAVIFRTFKEYGEEHWDVMCAEAGSSISHGDAAVNLWKQAATFENYACELRGVGLETGACWKISRDENRVQCVLRSAEGAVSEAVSLRFDSFVNEIAAQWLPSSGEDGRRRAIVACKVEGKSAPAILHLIMPNA